MHESTFLPRVVSGVLLAVLAASSSAALAMNVITREELKEMAIDYGRYDQRFVTCKMEPPTSIKIAFLKYAKSRGAGEGELDILAKVFDEGRAEVRNLRVGFSPEECKAKLETPKGREILGNIEAWAKPPN